MAKHRSPAPAEPTVGDVLSGRYPPSVLWQLVLLMLCFCGVTGAIYVLNWWLF